MKKWNVFKTIVKIGVISAYILLIAILVAQALTPGKESSKISSTVGDKINDVVTEIQKPEVTVVKVTEVKISSVTVLGQNQEGKEISISLGNSGKINSRVLPSNATNKSLTYQSSDESVIYVSSDGKISTKGLGNATVSVFSNESNEIIDSITITVIEVPLEAIEIGNEPEEFHVGEKHKLEISLTPLNASYKDIIWESSNTDVLTVDKSGVITAKGEGNASVTATSKVYPQFTSTVEVLVLPKVDEPVTPVEAVDIAEGDRTGYIGDQIKLSANLLPVEAKGKIIWSVSDEEIAEISQSGVVSCLKAGSIVVTAKHDSGIEDSITITIKELLTKEIKLEVIDIKTTEKGYLLKQGESGKVVVELDENATVFDIEFISSDEMVAKISPDGVIEAIKGGVVTITASSSYDGETVSESFELTIDPITLKDTVENFYYTIRKSIGHFGAFLVLGILGSFTYYIIFKKDLKGRILAFIVCIIAGFAIAGITEILQLPYFTEGRYCSFDDVILDFTGYCCAAIPIYLAILIAHPIKKLVNKD